MKKELKKFDILLDLKKDYHLHSIEAPALTDYLLNRQGWVYIAHSPINDVNGVAKCLKIGRTSINPMARAKSLSSTGVVKDYTPLFALRFLNCYEAENNIAHKLKKFRGNKEFFYINLDMAVDCIEEEYQRQKTALNRYFKFQEVLEDPNTLSFYLN